MRDITVVTGFYDVGRGNWAMHPEHGNLARSVDTYFGFFATLAALKNPMVIVTSADLADRVRDARNQHGLASLTEIIVKPLPVAQQQRVQANIDHKLFRNYVVDPSIPEFHNAGYSVVTNQKSQFVVDAIDAGLITTEQTAWIDFGYCRAPNWFNAAQPWQYDFGDKINLWTLRPPDDRPIFDVVRTALIYFMGCHIVGPTSAWPAFNASWQTSYNALLECGFADDDQTTLLMIWRKHPELFTLHAAVDRGPGSWYFLLRSHNQNQPVPPTLRFDAGVLRGP